MMYFCDCCFLKAGKLNEAVDMLLSLEKQTRAVSSLLLTEVMKKVTCVELMRCIKELITIHNTDLRPCA